MHGLLDLLVGLGILFRQSFHTNFLFVVEIVVLFFALVLGLLLLLELRFFNGIFAIGLGSIKLRGLREEVCVKASFRSTVNLPNLIYFGGVKLTFLSGKERTSLAISRPKNTVLVQMRSSPVTSVHLLLFLCLSNHTDLLLVIQDLVLLESLVASSVAAFLPQVGDGGSSESKWLQTSL